jgi:flagellar export protein FliJ
MRRFRFPLARLLWQRERQEDVAEQALAAAQRADRDLAREIGRLRGLATVEAEALRARLEQPTPGTEFGVHASFARGLAVRATEAMARRTEAARTVLARRQELLERRRAREVVSQLRERALARYRVEVAREEQRGLDETAVGRYARRAGESG